MTFIRTKWIKKKGSPKRYEYAYIVENKWRKRGNPVKQKTKKYLGRVYRFDRVNMMDFYEHFDISDVNSAVEIAERVLKVEHNLLPDVIEKLALKKVKIEKERVRVLI